MNQRNVPRPQAAMQNERPQNDNVRIPQQESTHPLVRQAPPVQERPEQQRNEEQKFNNWEQQHQEAAPREAPRPAERTQQPQERPQPQPQRTEPAKREPHQ
jgi:hypothetical protein